MDNSKVKESIVPLVDGRTAFKTDNGFKYWIESKKGVADEVSEDYYIKALNHRITKRNKLKV